MIVYNVKSDLTVVCVDRCTSKAAIDRGTLDDASIIVSDRPMTYGAIKDLAKRVFGNRRDPVMLCSVEIKKVKFSGPATIVFWADGSKTVVKCQEGDAFDPEKGLALCFMKKVLGNKSGTFNKVLKTYGKEESDDNA